MVRRPPPAPVDGPVVDFNDCEQRIGYVFRDKMLLRAALTHASGAQHRLASNERLEFLGDAILGAVVCEMLFKQYPEYLEGDLTQDQVDRRQPDRRARNSARSWGCRSFSSSARG